MRARRLRGSAALTVVVLLASGACDRIFGIHRLQEDERDASSPTDGAGPSDTPSGDEDHAAVARPETASPSSPDASAPADGPQEMLEGGPKADGTVHPEGSATGADSGDENADALPDALPEAAAPLAAAPGSLRLWLTADKGLDCRSGRVERWADQSGFADDAVLAQGQLGPQCQIAASPHQINRIDVPFFSAPSGDGGPVNIIDETLDVDLGFLKGSGYTVFVVERRSGDFVFTNSNLEHFDVLLGTNLPNESTFSNGDCSNSDIFNTMFFFGYVYYDPNWPVELSVDHFCIKVNAKVAQVPLDAAGVPTSDIAVFDLLRGRELFQGAVPLNADVDQAPLTTATGGAIGRGIARTTVPGVDGRFRGDIAEVIVYDTALDNAALTMVRAYLNAHWALSP